MDMMTTTDFDFSDVSTVAIACTLRMMVSARNDAGFMRRERVDASEMTEQADALYAVLMLRGYAPSEIAEMVPGVEIFAEVC